MEPDDMPKLDLSKDALKLTTSDLHWMKHVQAINLERVTKLKKVRFNNRILGSALAVLAAGIYSYTIYAVKQERFLDDFDEPAKVSDEEQ